MLFPKGLAVSLPLRDLRGAVLPSSIFDAAALAHAPIKGELACAIDLVLKFCALLGRNVMFIYRPEIFTHGETLAWLREKLGEIEDHLTISDGSAIKLVPGLQNHMFLYAPGNEKHLDDFRRLVERAPEILPQLGYQINSAFSFKHGASFFRPKPILLQANHLDTASAGELRKFYLNPGALDTQSVGRALKSPALAVGKLAPFKTLTFVPFNESALADASFCGMIAGMIVRSVRDQEDELLILGCPVPSSEEDKFPNRVTRLIEGIHKSGVILPRAILNNVLVSPGLIDQSLIDDMSGARTLVLHDTFEFWLLSPPYYAAFDNIKLVLSRFRRRDRAAMTELVADAAGGVPIRVARSAEPRGSLDFRGGYG